MAIRDDILIATKKYADSYRQNFCKEVCQPVSVVHKDITQQFVNLRCQSCAELVNYVTDEIEMLMDNTDWDYIYGPKKMSMQQAFSYLARERNQFVSAAKAIAEYASDDCDKRWGIRGRYETGLTIDQYKNPIISGLNDMFEEENVRQREYMTSKVATPQQLTQEANRCKRNARLLITRILAGVHRDVPRFDFNFYY